MNKIKDKDCCKKCNGTGTYAHRVSDGNPYSYNYQLKQDYKTVYEKCDWCKGTGVFKDE